MNGGKDWLGHLLKGMLVQKNTGSLWRKKRKEMPLQTQESSGWLWFIQKAHNGSKFPIRACLSLTHVCTCRYTSHLSCGKLKTCCQFVTCLIPHNTGFWWITFPKGKLQNTQKFAFVRVVGSSRSLWGRCSFPGPGVPQRCRAVLSAKRRAATEAAAAPQCRVAQVPDRDTARSSTFGVCLFSSKLRKWSITKPGRKQNKTHFRSKSDTRQTSNLETDSSASSQAHSHLVSIFIRMDSECLCREPEYF